MKIGLVLVQLVFCAASPTPHMRIPFVPGRMSLGLRGKTTELRCAVVEAAALAPKPAHPSRLEWRRNGAVIASFVSGVSSAEWWVSSPRMSLSRDIFSLLVTDTRERDSGTYQCQPTFGEGEGWGEESPELIRLDIIGPPSEPVAPEVLGFTSRQVTLRWRHPKTHRQGPVTESAILISQRGEDGKVERKWEVAHKGNETVANISGLRPYTNYEFQIASINVAGKSTFSSKSQPMRTKGEAPTVAPLIVETRNGSRADGVWLGWEPPPRASLHGPLVGYRIMAHKLQTGQYQEFYLAKPGASEYEVRGLDTYEKYMLSLAADNNFGYSPTDTAFVRTREGKPASAPILSALRGLDSRTLLLQWEPPAKPNGAVVKYQLYFRGGRANSSVVVRPRPKAQKLSHEIGGLESDTEFSVWATAWTSVGEGPPSASLTAPTDVTAPDTPAGLCTAFVPPASVQLSWARPSAPVSYYTLLLWSGFHPSATRHSEIVINSYNYTFDGISAGDVYFVSVKAATRSKLKTAVSYESPPSKRIAFELRKERPNKKAPPIVHFRTTACLSPPQRLRKAGFRLSCDPLVGRAPDAPSTKGGLAVGGLAAAAVIGAVLLLLGLCALFAYCRRRSHKRELLILDENSSGTYSVSLKAEVVSLVEYYDDPEYPSVPVEEFEAHVATLSCDSDAGFQNEFQDLETKGGDAESYATLLPENKPKNRYVNILAYDHSRVLLRNSRNFGKADYINANYVDGYKRKNCYIATQGPLPNTFGDFWRMVYEQRTMVIVMITNVVENGRKKCEQYWPSGDGAAVYGGDWEVKLLSSCSTAFYTLRMLGLRALCGGGRAERIVWHWHYRSWPDHGVPHSPLPLLAFVRKSAASNPPSAGPILVHCSAGVGRSGCYMLIESAMREAAQRRRVSLAAHLRHIRRQRNFLVQTEEQFVFCHAAVLELIRSGSTAVETPELADFVDGVLKEEDAELGGRSLLQVQHERATAPTGRETFAEAQRDPNRRKNRSPDFLPDDAHRALLACLPGVEGSDYINASQIPGYYSPTEYVISQVPLRETQADFWRLVWETKCKTIALLCPVDIAGVDRFWPTRTEELWPLEGFQLSLVDKTTGEGWSCMDLRLDQKTSNDSQESALTLDDTGEPLQCRLLHYPAWSELWGEGEDSDLLRNNCEGVWELVETVSDWHAGFPDTPLIIVDEVGGGGAGAFAILSTALRQTEQEGAVDVYAATKLLCQARPGLIASLEELSLLYDCCAGLARLGDVGRSRPSSSDGGDSGFASRFKLSTSMPSGFPKAPDPPADPSHRSILKKPAAPIFRDASVPARLGAI